MVDADCTREGQSAATVSPDGILAVQLVRETCDHGWIFVFDLTRLVGWRVAAPKQRYILAVWENYGESGQVPVEWTGTMAVRVDLRAPGGARVRPPPLAGLELTLVQAAPKRDDERRR